MCNARVDALVDNQVVVHASNNQKGGGGVLHLIVL